MTKRKRPENDAMPAASSPPRSSAKKPKKLGAGRRPLPLDSTGEVPRSRAAAVEFGRLLRKAREAAGLSQTTAAEKVGIAPNTWSGFEHGAFFPSWPTLGKLAVALGVPVADLLPSGRMLSEFQAD